ncbi:MAG TPA: FlgD immunoglobulin-like domain containing protein [Candidatus Eisenbacteria bacterium]|nr:FlgD immunoglobulin-like domain containing protein [Candidatus Eisenbacteria bacterium]
MKQSPKIRWFGERPRAAEAGREFVGQLEIIAPRPGTLDLLQITGDGWSGRGLDAAAPFAMGKGERRIVTFRATPQDPAQPLTIRAAFDGVPFEKSIRLDAASLDKKRRVRFVDRTGPTLSGRRPQAAPGTGSRAADQVLNFSGHFRYNRGDGITVGADNIIVKLWDDDSPDPFDEVIWSGMTDQNGHFEGSVVWDDCDLTGCDDPDVYLEIITTGQVADVQQDDLLETTWSWETAVIDDFTGNNIDFGVMTPGENVDEHAAVHIFNSMVRGHRFALNRMNMNTTPVDVLWPDLDDGSAYNIFFEEIHINPTAMWNEITHTHEFAHHLHNVFGNHLEPDYENGYCDPGHCYWCPEQVGEGWQEGVAYWYAMLVTEDYPSSYAMNSWVQGNPDGIYGNDGVGVCNQDLQPHPDGRTEGYVAALLRDMQDAANDDHDGDAIPDCDTDAMSLGYDEILTVFRDDDPTDIGMFLNSFRARYPEHDQDLWSTTRNVGPTFGFPLPDPIVLTQPGSCRIAREGDTVTLQAIGNGSLLRYQWRRNGVNLPEGAGATGTQTSTLTLSPVAGGMGGHYDCLVTTCDGSRSVPSQTTRLTVLDAPTSPRPYLTWGENYGAQCGNGTNNDPLPPGSYTGLTDVVDMDGGRSFSMALRADGTVYTWGRTEGGELGNGIGWGNYVHSPQPIALSNVIQIEAGNVFAMALDRDGKVKSWGSNFYGQLGDSTQTDRFSPWPAKLPGCVVALAAGYAHGLALREDGTVLGFGYNGYGAVGIGTVGGFSIPPTQVVGLTDIVAIAAAGYHSYALKADGTVWSWGFNTFGQLGNGTSTDTGTPGQVPGLSNIRAIAASYYNGYAIANTGEVYAWGRGDMGAIGDGSAAWRFTPVQIPGLANPREVVAGDAGWAMALMQDGTLRAWGYNAAGVLATGAPMGVYRYSHEPVIGIVAANHIAAGYVTAHVLGHLMGVTSAESEAGGPAPLALALRVAPVPSGGNTSLGFDLPAAGAVTISIFDVAGRLVRSVVSEPRPAGRHMARWDGRTREGAAAPAGVYFARLERGGEALTRRIVLVR